MNAPRREESAGSMYLVLPVPFRRCDGELHVEAQAANGLDRWADSFESVTVAAPMIPESLVASLAGVVWRPVRSLEHRARIVCQPLLWAYSPATFAKHLAHTRRQIARAIAGNRHLQFAIGGLVGDWAAIAALEAMRQKRRYAIHTDRVEHEVMRKTASGSGGLRRLKIAVEAPLMKRFHHHVIRHCSLGLWHGEDCFRAYAPWCAESHLVHDVHTRPGDLIDSEGLLRKLDRLRSAEVLQVCYAGRLDAMKAPVEWLRALAAARDAGARLHATWYGEGALLEQAQAECVRLNLRGAVTFAGFVADRAALLRHVREAQALVFTHITPESPRNLIEAMVCGTPILGYASAYASNLLHGHGGGALVPIHDWHALGTLLARLAGERDVLAGLTVQAAENGRRFSDEAVFARRSELVKQFA